MFDIGGFFFVVFPIVARFAKIKPAKFLHRKKMFYSVAYARTKIGCPICYGMTLSYNYFIYSPAFDNMTSACSHFSGLAFDNKNIVGLDALYFFPVFVRHKTRRIARKCYC